MGKVVKKKCEDCGKEVRSDNMARHKKNCKGDGPQRKNSKSKNFFVTWQKDLKYKMCMILRHKDWIQGLTIGREGGIDGGLTRFHSHALITTVEKMDYEEFQSKLPERADDLQTAKNVRDSVRYITKEDYKAICEGHDKDFSAVIWKAWKYFHKSKVLCVTDYPYCSMSRPQQVQFREFFDRFVQMEKEEDLHREMIEMELRQWQKQCMEELEKQDDRKILWIYDDVGNSGKTTLAKYLCFDVNLCKNDGLSPLYWASTNGHKDIVQILLE